MGVQSRRSTRAGAERSRGDEVQQDVDGVDALVDQRAAPVEFPASRAIVSPRHSRAAGTT